MSSTIYSRQTGVLSKLLAQAANTEIGRRYGFDTIETYAQFRQRLPLLSYKTLQPAVRRLKNGEANILWPGMIHRFAVSAGTTGRGKHLPLSDERLTADHRFMQKVAWSYLRQRPNIFRLWGDHLSMPGSVERQGELQVGEISGFTALNVPLWLQFFQLSDPRELAKLPFQQKFDLLLNKALKADLRVITAVPSWVLTLFQQALEKTDKQRIDEIWPNLQLLVCGGVKLANYRSHLEALAGGLSLDFIETYGASEGYIGFTDDLSRGDLRLATQNGIFFELIPALSAEEQQETHPLWEAETDTLYALVLSTNAGLWRYRLNDLIEFTSRRPLRFVVKGRVDDVLDDFGEAFHIYEAYNSLQIAAQILSVDIDTFSISPVMPDEGVPHHRWFIQFEQHPPSEKLQKMTMKIDQLLQQNNRHYAIRRETEALGAPEIKTITQAEINQWLKIHGKADAQGKLPKILPRNTGSLLE